MNTNKIWNIITFINTILFIVLFVVGISLTFCNCFSAEDVPSQCHLDTSEHTNSVKLSIQNPESCAKDTMYSEYVALIGSWCSGVIITPTIVLTAGHCVGNGANGWTVSAPYTQIGWQEINVVDSWSPYIYTGHSVNLDSSDIALVVMEKPFVLTKYPRIQLWSRFEKVTVMSVGRTKDNVIGRDLWTTVSILTNVSWAPYYYKTKNTSFQGGDSGGGSFLIDTDLIVGVLSGVNAEHALIARTNDLGQAIDDYVKAHGGWQPNSVAPLCPEGYTYK